jgi:regulator of protease activity HflC (stomatin/prohibitin superfamily)
MSEKKGVFNKITVAAVIIAAVLVIFNTASCVGPNQRGVKIIFGAVKEPVLLPGIQVHTPLAERIQKYPVVPSEIKMENPAGARGAITKGNQTAGVIVTAFWRYAEDRMPEIAKSYTEGRLEIIIKSIGEAAVKNAIGQYAIFDLAMSQTEITGKIETGMATSLIQYPITLTGVKLTNYDWSNEAIARNLNIEIRLRELGIEKIRVERRDGKYVPNNMYGPIPVNTQGGIQGR